MSRDFKIESLSEIESELAYVDRTFETIVITHILGCYMDNSAFPLYLAIHGPRGEGKTFQTLHACAKYKVIPYYISGAELSGSYEKDSISDIQKNLDNALIEYKKNGIISVFIIDDFHLSVASVDSGVSKTVNSQLLTGWLMNQSDRSKVSKDFRIPFILLGNDFANLYSPLTRDGRMDFFEWKPSKEVKKRMICEHFQDYLFGKGCEQEFDLFIDEYIQQPISFFSEIKKDIMKSLIRDKISTCKSTNCKSILKGLNNISEATIYNNNYDLVNNLRTLASARISEATAKNTIHEERK